MSQDLDASAMPRRLRLEACGASDRGRRRGTNQDAYYVNADAGLFIVSDGMGGARGGEVASEMVVATTRESLESLTMTLRLEAPPPAAPGDAAAQDICAHGDSRAAGMLLSALDQANRAVFEAAQASEDKKGMGATVAAVLARDCRWVAANVGDSPIYLFRDGQTIPLYTPHTLEAALEHAGMVPAAGVNGAHHVLTRAMGIDLEVMADHFEMPLQEGDLLCICSDGLSNKLSPSEILSEIQAETRTASLPEACARLVALANARGGEDNISVVLCRVAAGQAPSWLGRLGETVRAWLDRGHGASVAARNSPPAARTGPRQDHTGS